ncbi:hypothetical protein SDC9_105123 [bioreactor metagenome]|uniref:Uncharacterized protein n=1 Tax=bioreactor metagenome TaxID=1076179 RepID=A0A645AYE3_9ZZZZ
MLLPLPATPNNLTSSNKTRYHKNYHQGDSPLGGNFIFLSGDELEKNADARTDLEVELNEEE